MMRARNVMTLFAQSLVQKDSHLLVSEEKRAQAEEEHVLLDDPQEWPQFGKPAGAATPSTTSSDPATVPIWDSHVALEGMFCATCALSIEEALRSAPGIVRVEVSAAAHRARIVWDARLTKPSQWFATIAQAGYRAVPAQDT